MSDRQTAMDKVQFLLEALEEHRAEAEKDADWEWANALGDLLQALYKTTLPTASGQVKLTLELGGEPYRRMDHRKPAATPATKNLTDEELAIKCADAYSTDRYSSDWRPCVKMLRRHGLTDAQVEAVIRSKWTRWAGDAANKSDRVNSADLERYIEKNGWWGAEVEKLTKESI